MQVSVMGDSACNAEHGPLPAQAFGTQAHYYDDAAKLYADPKIRLHYPSTLFERVYSFAGDPFGAALDVATGTGQCAYQLASKYQQVWAVDANQEQLQHCQPHPRIHFCTGLAESTGIPSSSIDLVTVATALHWFDTPAFYKEARRVLKPEGALAAWCYTFPEIEHHAEANAILRDFRSNVLGPHLTEVSIHCERQYKDIEPSAMEFATVQRDAVPFRQESSIWHVVQLVRTGGIYAKMRSATPEKPDPLPDLQEKLMAALHTSDETFGLTLKYTIFMILAKDPRPL